MPERINLSAVLLLFPQTIASSSDAAEICRLIRIYELRLD